MSWQRFVHRSSVLALLLGTVVLCACGRPDAETPPAGPPTDDDFRPASQARALPFGLGEEYPGQPRAEGRNGTGTPPVVGLPRRLDAGTDFTAEPTLAIGPAPDQLLAGWIDTSDPQSFARMAIGQSFDGGETWDQFDVQTPMDIRTTNEGDPFFAVDPRSGSVWASGLAVRGGVFVMHRPPGATAFDDPVVVIEEMLPYVDKPLMALGPDPLEPQSTRLYITHNLGLQVSTDEGRTWSDALSLGGWPGPHPVTGTDGTLYIVYWDVADGIWLVRSLDGGRSLQPAIRVVTLNDFWEIFGNDEGRVPGRFRVVQYPLLAIDDRDGTLFCVYVDTSGIVDGEADVDIFLTRSSDRGATWTTPRVVNHDSDPPGDQFLPWLTIDRTGRLHMVFYDTRLGGREDSADSALLDAFYAYSEDRGETWTEIRLTQESFDSSTAWVTTNLEFVGDYLGLATAPTATGTRAFVTYMSTVAGDSDIYLQTVDFVDDGGATCLSDATGICLQTERFRVSATWEDQLGQSGMARGQLLTSDTGYFWFFSPDNVEIVIKVLDGCGITNHFWVFAGGMTNVGVELTVEDTETGEILTYENRLGDPFQPILDTAAFASCP